MTKQHRCGGWVLAGLMAATVAAGPAAADDLANDAGMGALAGFSTLLYAPVKLVYATAGILVGGIAWGLSGGDNDVMMAVMVPAVRGDYVITPAQIRMEEPIEFFGRDPEYRDSDDNQQVASGEAAAADESISHEDF
ncbi:MAG TPA: hypothetical protein VNF72_15820 [Myxococcota bacterium]|jgi:hypothetical protein|nr:hypothetical protein [Myxococcota bacterium]